jgi:cytochrome c oxidase subunit 3
MSEPNSLVAEQFEDLPQQTEAAHLGMWTFISTEILFFGGLFLSYFVYRHFYFYQFAVASRHTDVTYGTINSVILLTSSFTMALAVQSAKQNRLHLIPRFLALTILLAVSFVGVKGLEYHEDIVNHLVPGPNFNSEIPVPGQIFFWLYWVMTGLHGIHVCVGIGVLSVMTLLALRKKFSATYHTPLELAGLYWHFVDIVWIFLYPMLYIIQRHS